MKKRADLAVAALTINFQREEVIDFTKPFLNLGISILYKKPSAKEPSLFSFLSPFSIEIWLYAIAAYISKKIIELKKKQFYLQKCFSKFSTRFFLNFFLHYCVVVSFMVSLLAKFSPYEWQPPHPCKPFSRLVENQFSFYNSLWFTIGTLMQQGKHIQLF